MKKNYVLIYERSKGSEIKDNKKIETDTEIERFRERQREAEREINNEKRFQKGLFCNKKRRGNKVWKWKRDRQKSEHKKKYI